MSLIPPDLLLNRRIIIGVTGSIAIYKTCELIRMFIKAGAKVKIVMTPSAQRFITPLTFEALTHETVLCDFNENWTTSHNHIGLAQWGEICVIAPCTANSLAKIANGIADNILLSTLLASRSPKIIAASANTAMIESPLITPHMKLLSLAGYSFVSSQRKMLACGEEGNGAMADPQDIFYHTVRTLLKDNYWHNRRVIITGGGTKERIDPVRCITNDSTGYTSLCLALSLYFKGAIPYFITHQHKNEIPYDMITDSYESSHELYLALLKAIEWSKNPVTTPPSLLGDGLKTFSLTPFLFMASAVSDYTLVNPSPQKIKKTSKGEDWSLTLSRNQDILQSLPQESLHRIGFKAETDASIAFTSAQNMLHEKNLQGVCLNILGTDTSFGDTEGALTLILPTTTIPLPKLPKISLTLTLLENLAASGLS